MEIFSLSDWFVQAGMEVYTLRVLKSISKAAG